MCNNFNNKNLINVIFISTPNLMLEYIYKYGLTNKI